MNEGDVFVLDVETMAKVFVWYGAKSNHMEKSKGACIAEIIKNHEHGGNSTIVKIGGMPLHKLNL